MLFRGQDTSVLFPEMSSSTLPVCDFCGLAKIEEIVNMSAFRESNSLVKTWALGSNKELFDRELP